jgi:opacity protein-like surface antigen
VNRGLPAALALSCLLCGPAAAAPEQPAVKTQAKAVSLSVDGSFERYADSLSEDLRAGLEFKCGSEIKLWRSAFNWELETYYDHSRNKEDGSSSRADSAGLDLAKLMLARWHGADLKAFQPYLLAGAELTWLRESPDDGGTRRSCFLSPTTGIGAEFKLTKDTALKAEYRTNFSGGARRMSGLTLGLSYDIFGGDKDDD